MKGNENPICKPEQNLPLLLSVQHTLKYALASKNFTALAPKISMHEKKVEEHSNSSHMNKQFPSISKLEICEIKDPYLIFFPMHSSISTYSNSIITLHYFYSRTLHKSGN